MVGAGVSAGRASVGSRQRTEQAEVGQRSPGWTAPSPATACTVAASACPAGCCRSGSPRARSLPRPGAFGAQQAASSSTAAPRGSWTVPLVAPPRTCRLPQARGPAVADSPIASGSMACRSASVSIRTSATRAAPRPPPPSRPAGRRRMTYPSTFSSRRRHADQIAGVLRAGWPPPARGAARPAAPGPPAMSCARGNSGPSGACAAPPPRITAQNERQVPTCRGDKEAPAVPSGVAQAPRRGRANQVEPGQVLVHRALPAGALSPTLAV